VRARAHTHTDTHTDIHTRTRTRTHTQTHRHTSTHTYTHTNTHTNTHTHQHKTQMVLSMSNVFTHGKFPISCPKSAFIACISHTHVNTHSDSSNHSHSCTLSHFLARSPFSLQFPFSPSLCCFFPFSLPHSVTHSHTSSSPSFLARPRVHTPSLIQEESSRRDSEALESLLLSLNQLKGSTEEEARRLERVEFELHQQVLRILRMNALTTYIHSNDCNANMY